MTFSDSDTIDSIIVLGSTVTALAVVREAARIGKKVFTVDTVYGIAMKSRYSTKILVGENDDVGTLKQIQLLAGDRVALIADSDRWLRFILRNYHALKEMFGLVFHPDPESLEICLHKVEFLQWCHQFNFPAPILYDVTSGADLKTSVVYPVIVRPEETRHGMNHDLPKAIELRCPDDLRRCLTEFEDASVTAVVCESALSADVVQYSVGIARRQTGETLAFVAEKVRPVAARCGGGCFVVSCDNQHAKHLASEILNALNFYGIAEVEILWNPVIDKYWVIEVNARPWVQFPLAAQTGYQLLSFVLGEDSAAGHEQKGVKNAKWLWFAADLYECFSADGGLVKNRQLPFKDYLFSIVSSNTYAFWDMNDPRPFVYELKKFSSLIIRSLTHRIFKKPVRKSCL